MDFCTLEQVKSWLKITTVSDDDLLQQLITRLSEYIRSLLSRDIYLKTYEENLRDGNGADTIMAANWPLTMVASVHIDGQDIPVEELLIDDYSITLTKGRTFRKGRKNVKLVYAAGYSEIPADIVQMCVEIVGKKYRERDRIGVTSKTLAGEIISFSKSDLTDEVKSVLRQYQRVTPV